MFNLLFYKYSNHAFLKIKPHLHYITYNNNIVFTYSNKYSVQFLLTLICKIKYLFILYTYIYIRVNNSYF